MTKQLLFISLSVLLTLASVAAFADGAERSTHWRHDTIRYQGLEPGHWTDHEVRLTIRAAVDRWPVPGGVTEAFKVGNCESGLESPDSSPGSTYESVYQQSRTYWDGRQNLYDSPRWRLGESINNARANVIVSIRMAHARGWTSDWAGCA
jgi:hypothetical protein